MEGYFDPLIPKIEVPGPETGIQGPGGQKPVRNIGISGRFCFQGRGKGGLISIKLHPLKTCSQTHDLHDAAYMACMHGSHTRTAHMTRIHGPQTRSEYMACGHDQRTWPRC